MTAVAVTPLETRRDVVVHVARRAEELGYASMHVAEGWGLDAGALLAEIAVRTERIRIATGVLNVWGRSPATIAMLAATLDDISGGRFTLGLGSGSPQLAEGLHDTPFDAPVRRLGDTTRQVRRLLAGDRLIPTGAGHGGRPLRLATDPRPDVPIHLAGLGPAAVELAGEVADGWCPFLVPVSGLAEFTRRLEKGADRAGRPRPDVVLCPPVAVAPTRDQARELASWWVSFYLTRMGPLYRRTLERTGYADAVAEVVTGAADGPTVPASAQVLLDELVVWGEPDAARAHLDRWLAAGADQLALVLPPQRPVEELDTMLEALRPESR
jgi:alkanesulfonate monooxygenase SsuD/methylene tetrahydromethanopterin reductase-like flavin-dependent oxidoreductase (luciferase family)